MLVMLAFVADTFTMDAVFTEILVNDAFTASCKELLTNNVFIDAVYIEAFTNEALVDS